ncbi:MAG: hypothetical protein QNK42_03430 [Pseudodonghicola sp.]|nr:hypothetical protein [Pseudodonghicola sp.]
MTDLSPSRWPREGEDDARIDAAIESTRNFFHRTGIQTRLGEYDVAASDIETIVSTLTEHGMTQLGEHGAITPKMPVVSSKPLNKRDPR